MTSEATNSTMNKTAATAASTPGKSDESAAQHVRSITIVRHGRTAYNAQHRLQGQIDIPLDEVGRWQAWHTGVELARDWKLEHADEAADPQRHILVVASDLGRADATAHYFADELGVPVAHDERIRERSFGDWEGLSFEELDSQYPADFALWRASLGGELNHGAEPKMTVGTRGTQALLDWSSRAGNDTDLYVFSHGAWIAQTLQVLLGMAHSDQDFTHLRGMNNTHWARLMPVETAAGLNWSLSDYDRAPLASFVTDWFEPSTDALALDPDTLHTRMHTKYAR